MTDYSKLRELAQQATPGPYHIESAEHGEHALCVYIDHHDGYASHLVANRLTGVDAEFIAAANPDTVLALLDELRDAKAQAWDEGMNAAFQSFLRPLKDDCTRDVDTNPYREETR